MTDERGMAGQAGSARPSSCGRSAAALVLALLLASCEASGRRAPAPPSGAASPAPSEPPRRDSAREADELALSFRSGGPEAPASCAAAARAMMELGDLDRARRILEEGLAAHPGNPDILEVKANVLERLGFRRAAEACYDQVLEAEPERNSARRARAQLRLELGLAAAARLDLERCLEQGADDSGTWLAYARSLAATGETRRAYDAFARAFERGEGDAACLLAAASLYFADELRPRAPQDRDLATAWLRRAVALHPQDPNAHYFLALLLEERGSLLEARSSLTRAIDVDPQHLPALERLARLLLTSGEREQAAEMARRALELERRPKRREELERLLQEAGATSS